MIDLNQPVTFGKKGAAKTDYPSKKYMNLVQSDRKVRTLKEWIVPGVVILLILVLFVKFGIVDQFGSVMTAQKEVDAQQQSLDAANESLAHYEGIDSEFKQYSFGYLSSGESALINPIDAMNVVDQHIATKATLTSMKIAENTVTVTFSGASMAAAGEIIKDLEAQPEVVSASMSTVNASSSDSADITATITMQPTSSSTGGVK